MKQAAINLGTISVESRDLLLRPHSANETRFCTCCTGSKYPSPLHGPGRAVQDMKDKCPCHLHWLLEGPLTVPRRQKSVGKDRGESSMLCGRTDDEEP